MSGSLIPRRRTASAFGFCSPQAQKAADSSAPTLATDRQSAAYCAADADSLNGRAWAAIAACLPDAATGQFERKLGLHLGGGGGGGGGATAQLLVTVDRLVRAFAAAQCCGRVSLCCCMLACRTLGALQLRKL